MRSRSAYLDEGDPGYDAVSDKSSDSDGAGGTKSLLPPRGPQDSPAMNHNNNSNNNSNSHNNSNSSHANNNNNAVGNNGNIGNVNRQQPESVQPGSSSSPTQDQESATPPASAAAAAAAAAAADPPPTQQQPQPTAKQALRTIRWKCSLGAHKKPMKCTNCSKDIVTKVTYKADMCTYFAACCCSICGCCFIPFCLRELKAAHHFCPKCDAYLGSY